MVLSPVPARKEPALPAPSIPARPVERPAAAVVEPMDVDLPAPVPTAYTDETLRQYLPGWALVSVPTQVEGPLLQVRRVAASREPTSLRLALNETRGTIEIADEGPFAINDFRIFGESRMIRARPGFHPILRIDRANTQTVWSLPGVIVLEGKSLVLDTLDLIVNLRDLTSAQTSLFCCSGSDLTVRNCTITLINPANQPFTLVRAEGTAARGSRIRFEKTLIRGAVSSGFDLGKGAVDVALRETILLGSQGPLVRDSRPRSERRPAILGGWRRTGQPRPRFRLERGGSRQRRNGSPPPWSSGRLIRCSAGSREPGSPASCSRKPRLPTRETGLTGWVSRISFAAGRDIMPAVRSKRWARPPLRRSVPRGTEPIRTAERSSRPGRSHNIWARLFRPTWLPLFPAASRHSLRQRHLAHSSGPRPCGPFRRPRYRKRRSAGNRRPGHVEVHRHHDQAPE